MEEHWISINDHIDSYPNYRYRWLEVASPAEWDGSQSQIRRSAIIEMEIDPNSFAVYEMKVTLR